MTIQQGKIEAPSLVAGSPANRDIRLTASVRADLQGERNFDVVVRGNDLPLQAMSKLVALSDEAAVTGKVDLDAHGSGTLGNQGIDKAQWALDGQIASPQLTAFGLSLGLVQHHFEFDKRHLLLKPIDETESKQTDARFRLQSVQADYQITDSAFALNRLDATAFGGSITGSASFARTDVGSHQLDLDWADVTPQFKTSFLLPSSVVVQLQTSGNVHWTMPATEVDRPATHRGTAKLSIGELVIGRERVGTAELLLKSLENELQLVGSGNLFGGNFSVETASQLTADATWWDVIPNSFQAVESTSISGNGHIRSINVAQINRLFHLVPRRVDGWISGVFDVHPTRTATDKHYESLARISLDNVTVDQKLLTRRIRAEIGVNPAGIQVRSLNGSYASGQIDISGYVWLSLG